MKRDAAPIMAAVLLLLPVLYVGSYLALREVVGYEQYGRVGWVEVRYKFCGHWGNSFYWPLEQLHRTIRPNDWHDIRLDRFREREARRWLDATMPRRSDGLQGGNRSQIDQLVPQESRPADFDAAAVR